MKQLIALLALTSMPAFADCEWVWVDHDFNTATPAIRQQVCTNTWDAPAINTPSVRPIQTPQVRPIAAPQTPPVGTTTCTPQSVFRNGKWVTEQVCF
jgi:hypothetical protein